MPPQIKTLKKVRNNIALKVLLLLLYVSFYISNTVFIHTHFFATYSITHSHFYAENAKEKPLHTHDRAAFDTIAQFNAFTADVVLFFSLAIVAIFLLTLLQQRYTSVVLQRVKDGNSLRGPPAFVL